MSGGSFNYLGLATDERQVNDEHLSDLREMAEYLEVTYPDHPATAATRALHDRLSAARTRPIPPALLAVWKAVEWHRSNDYGPRQVYEALHNYFAVQP